MSELPRFIRLERTVSPDFTPFFKAVIRVSDDPIVDVFAACPAADETPEYLIKQTLLERAQAYFTTKGNKDTGES